MFFEFRVEDLPNDLRYEQLASVTGGGAMALGQLKTAGFRPISRYDIYRRPAVKV